MSVVGCCVKSTGRLLHPLNNRQQAWTILLIGIMDEWSRRRSLNSPLNELLTFSPRSASYVNMSLYRFVNSTRPTNWATRQTDTLRRTHSIPSQLYLTHRTKRCSPHWLSNRLTVSVLAVQSGISLVLCMTTSDGRAGWLYPVNLSF